MHTHNSQALIRAEVHHPAYIHTLNTHNKQTVPTHSDTHKYTKNKHLHTLIDTARFEH